MKKSLILMILSCWVVAGAFAQNGGYVDDLYRGSTRKSKEAAAKQAAKIQQSQQTQRMPVNWTPAQQTESTEELAPDMGTADHDWGELVTSYDEALERRLDAYKNYREMDDTYWDLMESYHAMLSRKYDPDLYNVITFGNEMWVEPVYISALFDGSDPAAGVQAKEFLTVPAKVSVNVNITPWGWDDPWDYWWYARWRRYPWNWGYYGPYWWGPSWTWGWTGYWGPSWAWGPGWWGPGYWGPGHWGPGYWRPGWWGPGHYPPYWGGGHGPHYGRPVIWGDNRPGWGPAPGYRPGGGTGGRPSYSGGFRRNENGTAVSINNGGSAVNRRPGNSSIRPGGSQNLYNPSRPTISGGNSGTVSRPVERSYRREVNTSTPTPRRQTQSTQTPSRSSQPTYSAPSRGSGSFGGGGGGSIGGGASRGGGGGGGYRR